MPRKAPDTVTEHRVTLGNYERELLKEEIDDIQMQMMLSNIAKLAEPVGIAIAGVGIGIGLYYGLPAISGNIGKGFFYDLLGDKDFAGYKADGKTNVGAAYEMAKDFFQRSLFIVPNEEGQFGFRA